MDSGVGGQIHGISLDSFLQMAQMEKTTCTLTVKTADSTGRIYLLKGDLIDADAGDLSGRDAAYEIISWENATIEIENSCAKADNAINMPLMNILMEGLKIKDDKVAARKAAGLPPEGEKPPPRPPAETTPSPPPTAGTTQTPAVPRPAKKGFPVKLVAGAAVALVVVGAVLFALGVFTSGGVEAEYAGLIAELEALPSATEQIDRLRAFTDSHEESEFTQKAEEKIKELQGLVEEQKFDEITAGVGSLPLDDNYAAKAEALYNQYLSAYPEGRFAGETRQKLTEISAALDDADFEKVKAAKQSGFEERIAASTRYMEKHPGGKHSAAVQRMLSVLSAEFYGHLKEQVDTCDRNESWSSCIGLCVSFIGAFKDDPRFEEVVALKIKLQGKRDLAELVAAATQKGSDYPAARQVYLAYLEEHPDFIHRNQVADRLSEIDEKIAQQSQWEEITADNGNKGVDINDRIDRLSAFMKKYPSSPFTGEAKQLMSRLMEEKKAVQKQMQKEAAQAQQLARIKNEQAARQREKARRLKTVQDLVARINKAGNRFKANSNETVADSVTGLTWTLLDSQQALGQCLNYGSGTNYVKGLTTGGHRDWRLPTAGELARIYKNRPFFPATGSPWYWSSEAYVKGYHRVANIVTTKQETVYNIEQEQQDQCGAVRAVRP